jgi:hypothetical protein
VLRGKTASAELQGDEEKLTVQIHLSPAIRLPSARVCARTLTRPLQLLAGWIIYTLP